MIGLALAILTTTCIGIGLMTWKMATFFGIVPTIIAIAGATAMMIFDYIRDHPKRR